MLAACVASPRLSLTIQTWSLLPPQSRKDKERLKQKHKKRPESPPSILAPPVVPTADKVLLPTPWGGAGKAGEGGKS